MTAERVYGGVQRQPLFLFHLNVNGIGPRWEEVVAASDGATVISLQDTRLRQETEMWARRWPGYLRYEFLHDEEGLGCCLLVRSTTNHCLQVRHTDSRHRLLAVRLVMGDGAELLVASLSVPPRSNANGGLLRRDLLQQVLGDGRAILVGDLNARARELGCVSTNANGVVLRNFVEESRTVVLNDAGVPTFSHNSTDFSDCLDWALASPAVAARFGCRAGEDAGSDHLPLLVFCQQSTVSKEQAMDRVRRWRTSAAGWTRRFEDRLRQELADRQLTVRLVPTSSRDIDSFADCVEEAFRTAADECLDRSRQRSHTSALHLPWWLLLLIAERKRLRRKRARGRQEDTELRRRLAALRKEIRRGVVEVRE